MEDDFKINTVVLGRIISERLTIAIEEDKKLNGRQARLAAAIGVTPQALTPIFQGTRIPSLEMIFATAKATGRSPSWLAGMEDIEDQLSLPSIEIIDDLMAPEFKRGDVVYFDENIKEPEAMNIFAVEVENHRWVRNIRREHNGKFTISVNDSAKLPDMTFDSFQELTENVKILGRLSHFFRRV